MSNKRVPSSSAKGRSSGYASTSSKVKTHSVTSSPETPEAGTLIPYIKVQDSLTVLPKYSKVLSLPKDEMLPAEDLDDIQLELENLLSTVALRFRVLKAEYDAVEKDERKDIRGKILEKAKQPSLGKRKRANETKLKGKNLSHIKITKQPKTLTAHSPAQSQHTDDSMDGTPHYQLQNQKDHRKRSLPKNDIPNKFWLSVEPYCMPLTNEDLKLLEDMLEQYSGPLIPAIPELGPHYSTTWAAEDIKEEQELSNTGSKNKSRPHNQSHPEVYNMIKKGEKIMGEGVSGPLAHRLVSALLEENIIGDISNADSNSSLENTSNSSNGLRSISLMKNGICIDKRLRKELFNYGLLNEEDFEKSQEDEVLSEVMRVLAELTAIAEYNSGELRRLHSAAKIELHRIELKRKLDTVDQDIIEMYKNVLAAKQKRRPLTADEQQEIQRLTAEQKRLSDQLAAVPTVGPH